MADVDIKYKGVSIATLNDTGTKTLQTSEKYCEDNIQIDYTKPTIVYYKSNTAPASSLRNNGDIFFKEPTNLSYSVTSKASGASYGFELDSDGYYVSKNNGVANSAAVCVVNFNLPVAATVKFFVINYAESGFDYGILGKIDTALSTSNDVDSTYEWNGKSNNSSSEQTVTYNMTAGQHTIYAKYRKDDSNNSYNDSLKFRVTIEPLGNTAAEIYKKVNNTWTEQTNFFTTV